MRQRDSQQDAAIVSSTEKLDENFNRILSKLDTNDTFPDEKTIEKSPFVTSIQSSVVNNPNESLNYNELNMLDQDKINFVRMCKQKLDKNEFPEDFDEWTIEQQHDHLTSNVDKYFPNIPSSLRFILPGIFKDGDCGRSASEKPDWLDMNKFRRGQKFVQRNFAGTFMAQVISLFQLFTLDEGLKTLILSQTASTPYRAFKRFVSTAVRVNHWYLEDPWDQETQAYRDIQAVRNLHRAMRQRLCGYSYEKFDRKSRIPNIHCPMLKTLAEDFGDSCPATTNLHCPYTMTRTKSVNQGEMSGTQFAFLGLMVLYPEKFGIHYASDEDLDAFCHMWRSLGYLLGIEDRYNFCSGSLQDVRKRCNDFVEHWLKPNLRNVTPEWEHMSICIHDALSFYVPMASYKVYLLYFCDILDLKMPRLYKSLNPLENAMYVLYKLIFDYLTMLPFVISVLNAIARMFLNLAKKFEPKKHFKLNKNNKMYYFNDFVDRRSFRVI